MFKVNDQVKCMRDVGALVQGIVYTVHAIDGHYIRLVGVRGGWLPDRFELVAPNVPTARANDPVTSKGKRKVNKYEQAVISALEELSAHDARVRPATAHLVIPSIGLTGKEIADHTDHPLNCITPRFAPLRRKGLIKDSGIKRDKQIVWVLV